MTPQEMATMYAKAPVFIQVRVNLFPYIHMADYKRICREVSRAFNTWYYENGPSELDTTN